MGNMKILLIEDDENSRMELRDLIKNTSFEVLVAGNEQEGFNVFQNQHPDIILTDVKLPEKFGLDLIKKIKNIDKDIPIIITAGFSDTEIAIQAIRIGALDYLKKPIDTNDLFVALGRARESVLFSKKVRNFPSILIAEDDKIARTGIADILKEENYHTLEAEDGKEAVDIFNKNKIDIILLDIKMPKMNGIEVLKILRKNNKDFETIILTGYGDESDAITAMRNGSFGFLKKPIDLDQLLILIQKAIEKLTLKRALTYRSRELEIANQIIAQINQSKEIEFRLPNAFLKSIEDKGKEIIDTISDSIIVINTKREIVFKNMAAKKISDADDKEINEKVISRLLHNHVNVIDYNQFIQIIDELFDALVGTTKIIKNDNNKNIAFITVSIELDNEKNKYILGIIN